MNTVSYILEYLEATLNSRRYNKYLKLSKDTSVLQHLLYSNVDSTYVESVHPLHEERLQLYTRVAKSFKKGSNVKLNYGDSLTDYARNEVEPVHDGVFSIGGSWPHHVRDVVRDTVKSLKHVNVTYVSIGCLGGNPMLVYRNYEDVVRSTLQCLNYVRSCFPNAHVTVYGLPPVYNLNVNSKTYEYDGELLNWVERDGNASFLSLKAHFGTGFGKLFPSTKFSSDGVHFNPSGAKKFAQLLLKTQK